MEQELSILIADLSGYTALTEAHGPETAADLIDQYLSHVDEALVGDCYLHERVGDEVMIVSASANNLAATASLLLNNIFDKAHFLQLHGGLHTGILLKRNNSFFGSSLNVASRIAAKASPGTFLCSDIFFNALSDTYKNAFTLKGKYGFKNVKNEMELYQFILQSEKKFFIDPICRMLIGDTGVPHPTDTETFFCSTECLNAYLSK
jgi:class 3 adenylate cyclase